MTDFRELCAELADSLEEWLSSNSIGGISLDDGTDAELIYRARTALAQPEPQRPTLDCDEIEVPAWHRGDDFYVYKEGYTTGWAAGVNAAADCWARPAIEPVPIAERLPGPEDCDAEGCCWVASEDCPAWHRVSRHFDAWHYWLPHHALPVPQQEAGHG